MTTAANISANGFNRSSVSKSKNVEGLFKSKHDIMKERQLQQVEVVPVNQTHEVYLKIKANRGVKPKQVHDMLPSLTSAVVNTSIKALFEGGYLVRSDSGAKNNMGNPEYFYRVSEKEYIPRPVVRKVAPNDKKAKKSIAKKKEFKLLTSEHPTLELVKGVMVVDPESPHFEEVTGAILPEITTQIPKNIEGPLKPIVTMFFDVEGQTIMLSPNGAHQLWEELSQIFDRKG